MPASVQVYFTLELQHPGFVDESSNPIPIRCVTGVHEDMQLGIEDGAVFDAGQMATFAAIPSMPTFPEFAEGKVPETRIIVDNVSRELVPHIEVGSAASGRPDCDLSRVSFRRSVRAMLRAGRVHRASGQHDRNPHRGHGLDR